MINSTEFLSQITFAITAGTTFQYGAVERGRPVNAVNAAFMGAD